MNATFVLLTAAWFAGDAPAASQPAAATHAPAVVAAPAHGCGGCCDACNDCCGESWGKKAWGRLRGRFHKDCCDDCCSSCCTPAPCCKPAPCCTPAPCCKPAPCTTCCDSCCEKESFWSRLKGRFHKSCDDCCDSCGCSGCGSTVAAPAAKPAEQIPAPGGAKEMPKGEKTGYLVPRPIAPVSSLSLGQ